MKNLIFSMEGMTVIWSVYYVENEQLTKNGHVCKKPEEKCCYLRKKGLRQNKYVTSIFFQNEHIFSKNRLKCSKICRHIL